VEHEVALGALGIVPNGPVARRFERARKGHRIAREKRFGERVDGGFGQVAAVRVRPPVGERLEALLKRHGPGEPVVAEHA
jgi:hypothetical protein